MYKMIFSDIDGTLLDSHQSISCETKRKIKQLDERGIPFVLASSRLSAGVFTVLDELEIKAPAIAYSGALIYNGAREIIRSLEITASAAREIHDFIVMQNPDICCCTYSGELWLADDKSNPWLVREEEITELEAIEGKISDFPDHTGVHKLLCMGDAEDISEISAKLKRRYSALGICRSKNTYLEINNAAATKANAMRFLCDYMNISVSEAIAFGDGGVDMDMILSAGAGFVMSNAPKKLRALAPNVAASNDDDGVLRALIMLGL